jgi:hypothetical protein
VRKILINTILILWGINTNAQKMIIPGGLESNRIIDFTFSYSYNEPGGDLGSRFGSINQVGFGVLYKTSSNWIGMIDGGYQFGGRVKETGLLTNLLNGSRHLSNISGFPAEISISQRGIITLGKLGRFIPTGKTNKNSGFILMIGCGYYMHKIHIGMQRNDVAPLQPDILKGYDRLTGGVGISQFIGYAHHSRNKYYNFIVGLELVQSFTRSYRGYNYNTMQYDKDMRNDNLVGIKVGWSIPIYLTNSGSEEFIYK